MAYSNALKSQVLLVSPGLLDSFGAVSGPVAEAMVEGSLAISPCADVAVSVTGIAGPGGGSPDKPVGTVYIAWQERGKSAQHRRFLFSGNRELVRTQAAFQAMRGLIALLT